MPLNDGSSATESARFSPGLMSALPGSSGSFGVAGSFPGAMRKPRSCGDPGVGPVSAAKLRLTSRASGRQIEARSHAPGQRGLRAEVFRKWEEEGVTAEVNVAERAGEGQTGSAALACQRGGM